MGAAVCETASSRAFVAFSFWGVAGLNAASHMVSLRRLLSPGALTPAGCQRSKALTGYFLEGMKVRGGFHA